MVGSRESSSFMKKIIILKNKILTQEWDTYSKNFYSFIMKKIIILKNKILTQEWDTYFKNFYSFILTSWSASFSNQSLFIRKEALETRFSGSCNIAEISNSTRTVLTW